MDNHKLQWGSFENWLDLYETGASLSCMPYEGSHDMAPLIKTHGGCAMNFQDLFEEQCINDGSHCLAWSMQGFHDIAPPIKTTGFCVMNFEDFFIQDNTTENGPPHIDLDASAGAAADESKQFYGRADSQAAASTSDPASMSSLQTNPAGSSLQADAASSGSLESDPLGPKRTYPKIDILPADSGASSSAVAQKDGAAAALGNSASSHALSQQGLGTPRRASKHHI